MKLIVTGATGFVGAEIVRLALRNKSITSIVAITRKPIQPPQDAGGDTDTSKLHSVVLEDWTKDYPDSVKEQIKGADACIWNVAITPTKSQDMDFGEVTKVCHDYTINGAKSMAAVANTPFRFIYTSGIAVERDQGKPIDGQPLAEYRKMRGRTETKLIEFAKQHSDFHFTSTRPGIIEGPGRNVPPNMVAIWAAIGLAEVHVPIHVSQLSAAMIDLSVNGFEKDIVWPKELVGIADKVIRKEHFVS